jgi:cysteine synthase B
MILESVTDYIGNTPLLKIPPEIHGLEKVELYAKCELFNPFGSVKDRTALALAKGHLSDKSKTFLESSSGNTAKALQIIFSMHGVPFKSVTNRIKTPEVRDILTALGCELEELPGLSECPDPTDPNDPIAYIADMAAKNPEKYAHNSQYYSLDNPAIHHITGREIFEDIGAPDYFFGGLGTTGSTRGAVEFLMDKNPGLRAVGIVGRKGDYIPGIRNMDEMREVGIFERKLYYDIAEIGEQEAIEAMLLLNRKCGLLCGPTTGGAFAATVEYLRVRKPERKIKAAFIACDRMEWYVSYLKKRRPDLFGQDGRDSIKTMTASDLSDVRAVGTSWIAENSPIVIDLRGNMAFRTSHIPNSINITDNIFEEMIQYSPPFSKGQKILLVCPVGDKSRAFAAFLAKKGFAAYSLDGGIVKYRDLGLPLERGL